MKIITTISITNTEYQETEQIVDCIPCQAICCQGINCVGCPLKEAARNLRIAQEEFLAKLKEIPRRDD